MLVLRFSELIIHKKHLTWVLLLKRAQKTNIMIYNVITFNQLKINFNIVKLKYH